MLEEITIGDIKFEESSTIYVSDWLYASIILTHYKGYFFNLISSYNEERKEKPSYLLVTLLSKEIMKKDKLSPEEALALASKIAKHRKFPDIQKYISEKTLNEMAQVIMQEAVELISLMIKEKKEEIESDLKLDIMTREALKGYQQAYSELKGYLGNFTTLNCQAKAQATAMKMIEEKASDAELQRAMDEIVIKCEKDTKSMAENIKKADEENEQFITQAKESITPTNDPFADPLNTLPSIPEIYTP